MAPLKPERSISPAERETSRDSTERGKKRASMSSAYTLIVTTAIAAIATTATITTTTTPTSCQP